MPVDESNDAKCQLIPSRSNAMIKSLLQIPRASLHYFQLFRSQAGNRIFLLILLTAIMSYAESIGIALFFPLLTVGQGSSDPLTTSLNAALKFMHIPPTPLGVLPFIVLVFVVKGVLQFFTTMYQLVLHSQVTRRLRRRLLAGFCRADYRTIIGTNAGQHANLLVAEIDRFGDAFLYFIRTIPPAVNVAVFLAVILVLDWRLTLVFGVLGLCSVAFVQTAGRLLAHNSKVSVIEHGTLASQLIQMIHAFKYLRTVAGFIAFEKKIDASADRLAHAQRRTAVANALAQSIAQPLAVSIIAAIIFYKITILRQPMGSLLVLLAYFFRMISEIWAIQVNWQGFYGNVGSVNHVQAELTYLNTNTERNGSMAFLGFKNRISVRDVSFRYVEGKPVLTNINLDIACNSTVAFVGESGSGKSTLVDLIAGTIKPASGTITVDGQPLSDIDMETMRHRIGYVPQDAALFNDTVAGNITLWSSGDLNAIREAARKAQCIEFIEAMPEKFATQVGDRGAKLSGGQRQRIAIARELFRQPEILILDEATSSLDSESERAIQKSIDSLKGRITILIIAHRLSTIRNCDCIFVLEEGRIIESGSFDALLSNPESRFSRMCRLQNVA